jgi:hypothetical protein
VPSNHFSLPILRVPRLLGAELACGAAQWAHLSGDRDRDRDRDRNGGYYNGGYYNGGYNGGYYGYGPTYGINYSSPTPVVETFQPSSQFIPMNDLTGNGIELSMIDGACNIRELTIFYADGRQVIVPVGAYLDSMRPRINILTETSPISGITVVGTGSIGAFRY